MMKKIIFFLIFSALTFESFPQFVVGKHYAGPMIGLSFLGSTFQIGGGYEYGIHIENFGNVGVGGLIRYWSYSEGIGLYEWDYTNFLIGAQGNYHFQVNDDRFDPWAGLVLAYNAGSVDFNGPLGIYNEPSHGGLWLGIHGGLRYWLQPNLALSSRIGFGNLGYGALDIGVDFKF